MSNDPETVGSTDTADGASPVYLYQDSVPGRTRVWLHHANSSGGPLYFVVRVTNTQSSPIYVYLNRASSTGSSHPITTTDPPVAGGAAWGAWWYNNPPGGADTYLTSIGSGSEYDILKSASIGNGDTASEIVDFVCTLAGGTSPVGCKVTVMCYSTSDKQIPATPTNYAASDGTHHRGTFGHASRSGSVLYYSSNGSEYVEYFTGLLPGEQESGYDATNPTVPATNPGNYGVDYTVTYTVDDNAARGTIYGYLDDKGGRTTYWLLQDGIATGCSGGVGSSNCGYCGPYPRTCNNGQTNCTAYNFSSEVLNGRTVTTTLRFSLPGGSAGGQLIYWAP